MLTLIEHYWIQPILWAMLVLAGYWIAMELLRVTKRREMAYERDEETQLDEASYAVMTLVRKMLATPVVAATMRRVVKLEHGYKEVIVTVNNVQLDHVEMANEMA